MNTGIWRKGDSVRITAVGGGTGLSTLLRGLKRFDDMEITAIVAVTDEGGSSGVIRKEFKVPPPGDVRNNFVALAENEEILDEIMNFRFENGFLKGHTVGNVLLAALTIMRGSLAKAIETLSQILAVRGRILPVSDELIRLVADFEDGESVTGEMEIVSKRKTIKKVRLDRNVEALEEVVEALKIADIITIGPGSLYTSIITNLLVSGVGEAIRSNLKAKKIYIANIMTQPGETDGYTLSDHVREIERYLECEVDFVVANSKRPPDHILKRYAEEGYHPVELDVENVDRPIIFEPMIAIFKDPYDGKEKIRHDPIRLSNTIFKLARMGV